MFHVVCAVECSEFDSLRPDKGKKQDSENMDDSAQDGKFIELSASLIGAFYSAIPSPSFRLGP